MRRSPDDSAVGSPQLHILGRPVYRFLTRQTKLAASNAISIPIGFSNAGVFVTTLFPSCIQSLQALRIAGGWALLTTQGLPASNLFVVEDFTFAFQDISVAKTIRAWPFPAAVVPTGPNGLMINIPENEFILASDFAEQGGLAGHDLGAILLADINNGLAAAQNIFMQCALAIEIFQAEQIGT